MSNSNDIKEKFYEDLKATTGTVTKEDKFVILGDFNVKFGADYKTWEGVLGKHGIGKCNRNSLLLLETYSTFNLLMTNSVFHLPHRNKTSWMHPCSKH